MSSSSDTVSDNLIVDFDELGKPLAVTLEHHAQIGDSSTIEPSCRSPRRSSRPERT